MLDIPVTVRSDMLDLASVGGNQRTSQEFATADGRSRLLFTRYNASATKFESKMEYTEDGGKSWMPGNHQVFRRSGAGE